MSMNSILDLEKCIPKRGNVNLNWQVLERSNHAKRRSENKRILPLSIMVKIKGPPKVLDPYKLKDGVETDRDPPEDSSPATSCTPLNLLPAAPSSTKSCPSPDKNGLPQRQALLQSKQIPGRYFPKAGAPEDHCKVTGSGRVSSLHFGVGKPSQNCGKLTKQGLSRSYDFNKSKAEATNAYNEKILRQRKSLYEQSKDKNSLLSISFNSPDSSSDTSKNKDAVSSNYFSVQRFLTTSRHVTFPIRGRRFGEILKGTTKEIHTREDAHAARLASMSARNSSAHVHFEEPTAEPLIAAST